MSDYKEILYEKQRGGVLITLNRPEALNAITRSMLKELHQALDEAEADPEIRAVVLTGAGRRVLFRIRPGNHERQAKRYAMAPRDAYRYEHGRPTQLLAKG
jgi:1,4-dihydroxy-2-naphthoyl-CoA synthase